MDQQLSPYMHFIVDQREFEYYDTREECNSKHHGSMESSCKTAIVSTIERGLGKANGAQQHGVNSCKVKLDNLDIFHQRDILYITVTGPQDVL